MKVLIVGYGSLGQGVTPLLIKDMNINPSDIHVITGDARGYEVATHYGIGFEVNPITETNYQSILSSQLKSGDILLNLSVDVSSIALIDWCQENQVLYTDTCIEPWAGGYENDNPALRTNAHLRNKALALREKGHHTTALVAHGANPGLISYFVRQAVDNVAKGRLADPTGSHAVLAKQLGLRTIIVAERDTQHDGLARKPGEFANTWSVDGFLSEAQQPAEFGWGSHELDTLTITVNGVGAFLNQRGIDTMVKSWVPSIGDQTGYLITHHESLSLVDHLSHDGYRPTVFYSYNPSPKTCESIEAWRTGEAITDKTIVSGDLKGIDELGALLVFDNFSYWYGSTLFAQQAAMMVPHNSATTLQVTATIVAGLKWMIKNPNSGIVEAEDLPYGLMLNSIIPYLGEVSGHYTDWTPGPSNQFKEFLI